ncbi:MAG TPA: energy transducer TonB [Bryobacteraceae bacterium]|nr:energy transducer TonB [Bryobacteraceae bacterium]
MWKQRWFGAALAAGLALIVGCGVFLAWQARTSRVRVAPHLSLRVERTESALRLVWDPNAPALRNLTQAVLRVTDGSGVRRIVLDQQQLRNGNIVCFPSGGDVKFELEVPYRGRPYTESVQVLMVGNAPLEGAPARPSAFPEAAPPAPAPEPEPAAPPVRAAVPAAKQPATPRQFVPPPDTEVPSTVASLEHIPAPPAVQQRAVNAPAPITTRRLSYTSTAICEPIKPSRLRRVIGKVPGLRRLQRSPETDEDFVPAKAVAPITFTLPSDASPRLMQKKQMDLKAAVDETGRVTRVELLAIPDEELVTLASYAASQWRFQPAKLSDKPIPSEVILHFRFDGN